jgi:16S rRNA (adenine1518-N6/adenine1519-N6)-dimethyltransferase
MTFFKKSLGQNFLIDKNIINKIIDIIPVKNKNIIEIGPGKGALTNEILNRQPRSIILIEKDFNLAKKLKQKYEKKSNIEIHNIDILKFNLEKKIKKKYVVFGNLPYNISSQILVKFLKFNKWPPNITDYIFMFQKELGKKIIGKFPSNDYGRLSILTNFRLKIKKFFYISPNCFFPKPKVTSMIIHFKPKMFRAVNIKRVANLENITNIMFSNKRKMINKNIKKILNKAAIEKISELKLNQRPSEIKPEIYYKITELFERI